MNAAQQYLKYFVDPTFDDFSKNPQSERHMFLSCVTAFHTIDRIERNDGRRANLRNTFRTNSIQFSIIDMIAHRFKHVISDTERAENHKLKPGVLRLSHVVLGYGTIGSIGLDEEVIGYGGFDFYNLYYAIRDGIAFLHREAAKLPDATF